MSYQDTDPDRAVSILREGCLLAEEVGDRWLTIALYHWLLAVVMGCRRDYRQVIELAIRNTLAVSKPENAAFPDRWVIYLQLAEAYLGIDPEGHAELIRETLMRLDRDTPAGAVDQRCGILNSLCRFHLELGEFEDAKAAIHRIEEMNAFGVDEECRTFTLVFLYAALCWMAYKQGDWKQLSAAAELGEGAARAMDLEYELSDFFAWQAVLARLDGDEQRAARLLSTAAAKLSRRQIPPEREYPDAMAFYHELGDDLGRALEVRDWELACVKDTGRFAYECEVHLKRAALLAKMSRLRLSDLETAREAALKLQRPEKALTEIDALREK
jgi:hypothetical protein